MSDIGHNAINSEAANRWLHEIGRVYEELDAQKIENMNRCRSIRERLPDIYERAKDEGMPVKALKAAVKVMRAEKALESLIEKATPEDDEDAEAFEYLRQIASPGDLFDAATRGVNDDDDDDVRPEFLKRQDADREAAAENGKKLRKGIKGLPGADATEA